MFCATEKRQQRAGLAQPGERGRSLLITPCQHTCSIAEHQKLVGIFFGDEAIKGLRDSRSSSRASTISMSWPSPSRSSSIEYLPSFMHSPSFPMMACKRGRPYSVPGILPLKFSGACLRCDQCSVGSSAGAFELLTRFDTSQPRRTFFAAGLGRSWLAPPSIRVDARTAAVRRA